MRHAAAISGRYVHHVPVRIAFRRWRPSSGCASPSRFTAAPRTGAPEGRGENGGDKMAIVAVAHSILVIAYHLLGMASRTASWAAITSTA